MHTLVPAARVCLVTALCAALLVTGPAFTDPTTPWTAVLALAALHTVSERALSRPEGAARPGPGRFGALTLRTRHPGRHRAVPGGGGTTGGAGTRTAAPGGFHPVLLAGVLLLPAPAAALVAVPGALLGRVDRIEQGPALPRRLWRAASLALGAAAGAFAHTHLGGPAGVAGARFPGVLLPAAAGVLTFCTVLGVLDGAVRASADRVPVRTAWSGRFGPFLGPAVVQGLAGLMMAVLWRSPYGPLSALLVLLPMYISVWVFAQYHRERAAHQATIRALVQAVDIKDRYTRGHSERVGRACLLIARELGFEEGRVEVLRFAGILHDVGKLGVPTRLLRKEGKLTPEERRVIELHPEYGHEIVRGIGFLGEARAAVLHHHEKLDGSGYPYGLSGYRIPESARVVAVADAFDAMTSTRSYSRGRPVPAALAELRRCAGTHFDPRMVHALIRALEHHGWNPAATADVDDALPPVPGPVAEPSSPDPAAPPASSPPPASAASLYPSPSSSAPAPGTGPVRAEVPR